MCASVGILAAMNQIPSKTVRGLAIPLVLALSLLSGLEAGCGEEAPTQVTIDVRASSPLEGATTLVLFIKEEATDATQRLLIQEEQDEPV